MMLDQVKNLSYQMRLFGIHQACERRAAEALSQQLHRLRAVSGCNVNVSRTCQRGSAKYPKSLTPKWDKNGCLH